MKRKECFCLSVEQLQPGHIAIDPVYANDPEKLHARQSLRVPCSAKLTRSHTLASLMCDLDPLKDDSGLGMVRHLEISTDFSGHFDPCGLFDRFRGLQSLALTPAVVATQVIPLERLGELVPGLRALFLPFCPADLNFVRFPHSLRFLDLSGSRAPDHILCHVLSGLDQLEGLDLSYTNLGPLAARALVAMSTRRARQDHHAVASERVPETGSLLQMVLGELALSDEAQGRHPQGLALWLTFKDKAEETLQILRHCSMLWMLCVRNSIISETLQVELKSLPSVAVLQLERCDGAAARDFWRAPLEVKIAEQIQPRKHVPRADVARAEEKDDEHVPNTQSSIGIPLTQDSVPATPSQERPASQDSVETVPPTQVPASPLMSSPSQ